jgi:cephalosporin hydroxylase
MAKGKQDIESIKEILEQLPRLKELLKEKLDLQDNIPTYTDKKIQSGIKVIESLVKNQLESTIFDVKLQAVIETLKDYYYSQQSKRFQAIGKRHLTSNKEHYYPQGLNSSLKWKGLSLIKTAEDAAILPQLIQDLKPSTIIEIGSGSGASAIWMADHLKMNHIEGKVYSIDREKVNVSHPSVDFIQGDAKYLESLLSKEKVMSFPHPWLIVDDAHTTLVPVLNYLYPMMQNGDYVFVEDSGVQQEQIGRFVMTHDNALLVDTFYTDFFGRNSVSAKNSILKKVK